MSNEIRWSRGGISKLVSTQNPPKGWDMANAVFSMVRLYPRYRTAAPEVRRVDGLRSPIPAYTETSIQHRFGQRHYKTTAEHHPLIWASLPLSVLFSVVGIDEGRLVLSDTLSIAHCHYSLIPGYIIERYRCWTWNQASVSWSLRMRTMYALPKQCTFAWLVGVINDLKYPF